MSGYVLDEATMLIAGPDGSTAIDADVTDLTPEERLGIAVCLRDLANGFEADLPPPIAFHWAFFGKPLVDPGRIYAKAPATIPELGKARVWRLVAMVPDAELGKRLCLIVNGRLGWDVDGDVHRNIVDNKTIVVRPGPDGRWGANVLGEDSPLVFDGVDDARRYAISVAMPWNMDSRDLTLRKDVRDFEVGMTFHREDEPGLWRVTDIGRRTMQAIRIDGGDVPVGPPYGGSEVSLDEEGIANCRYAEGDEEENEFRLCFVKYDEVERCKVAYFATGDFENLETEGWSVFSRQSNASAPYPARRGEYQIRTVMWTGGDLKVEPEGESAEHLNRLREKPWLVSFNGRRIFSGMPLGPFRQAIVLMGGVMLPDEEISLSR